MKKITSHIISLSENIFLASPVNFPNASGSVVATFSPKRYKSTFQKRKVTVTASHLAPSLLSPWDLYRLKVATDIRDITFNITI